ncbi:uncharacterized protein LOC111694121 [Trichogramma pretiosum]|uniref:uncharacterized protein LOC111694121 n=1 Tax=Trichogramma pretiosum TaxID=7493 RepID=UPI000C719F1A|nr:uncharacterized protein LOC111694121 [Trichogramma pretiosum]
MSESGDESPESVHTESDDDASIESVHSDDDDVSDIEIDDQDDESDRSMHTASDDEDEEAALTNESDISARSLLYREGADDDDDKNDNDQHEESFDYGQKKLDTLMRLREKVNWRIEEERVEFFLLIDHLMTEWLELPELPDLRNCLQPEEMDWLLAHVVAHVQYFNQARQFIEFVVRTGYKDRIDENPPQLLLRRTTAIHHAAKYRPSDWRWMVEQLFEIYDKFEVNYSDESGLTHFHVACMAGLVEIVRKFLELGHEDPDLVWPETGDSPLHLALTEGSKETMELLLRNGADPNRANYERGSTPLHVISRRKNRDDGSTKLFLEICDELNRPVSIDARDKSGRTPLQLAVANLKPHAVEILLDRGADPASFVVTIDKLFDDSAVGWYELRTDLDGSSIAGGALAILESLESRGYKVEDYGSIVAKIFGKLELFQYSADLRTANENWYDDEEFASRAKTITILPCIKVWHYDESSELARESDAEAMSLYDLIRLAPEAAATVFEFRDYYDWDESFAELPKKYEILVKAQLCETMSRRCCDKIMGRLIDEEVADICFDFVA